MRTLVIAIVVALTAPLCYGRDAATTENDLARHWWNDRLALAHWCVEQKLVHEADTIFSDLIRSGPSFHHEEAKQGREKLKDVGAEDPDAKLWASFLKQERAIHERAGSDYVNLAKLASGNARDAYYEKALYYDSHNKDAREARGEKRIEGHGWFSEKEYAEFGARYVTMEDRKAPEGTGPLILKTEHYSIIARTSLTTIKKYGAQAELLHKAFREVFGDAIPAPKRRLGIHIFRSKGEYKKKVETLKQPDSLSDVAGIYLAHTGVVYICEPNTRRKGGVTRTINHECAHQLVSFGLCGDARVLPRYFRLLNSSEFTWIVEGVAVYFEPLKAQGDSYEIGGIDKYRKPLLSTRKDQKKLDTLDAFFKLNRSGWGEVDTYALSQRYAMGGALVGLCLNSGNATRKSALTTMLQRHYRGFGSASEFAALLGDEHEKLAEDWKALLDSYLPAKERDK